MFIIGYFAGARETMGKIGMCVILVTVVSTLALPAPMALFSIVKKQLNVKTVHFKTPEADTTQTTADQKTTSQARAKNLLSEIKGNKIDFDEEVPLPLQLLTFFLYLAWIAFLVAMGIFIYETWTVTAKEAERH
jgi:hypothetical protein